MCFEFDYFITGYLHWVLPYTVASTVPEGTHTLVFTQKTHTTVFTQKSPFRQKRKKEKKTYTNPQIYTRAHSLTLIRTQNRQHRVAAQQQHLSWVALLAHRPSALNSQLGVAAGTCRNKTHYSYNRTGFCSLFFLSFQGDERTKIICIPPVPAAVQYKS